MRSRSHKLWPMLLGEKILDLGVSVARAISGEFNLNYRGERLYKGNSPCYYQSAHTNDLTFVSRHELKNSKLSMQGKIDSICITTLAFRHKSSLFTTT